MTVEEKIMEAVRALPLEKQLKVQEFVEHVTTSEPNRSALKNPEGLWRDLGVDITEEDIREARREMWGNFPREFPE